MKLFYYVLLSFGLLVGSAESADDDMMLLVIPAIVSANQCQASDLSKCRSEKACKKVGAVWVSDSCLIATPSLTQIIKLAGDWDFQRELISEEFRFYENTIRLANNTTHIIDGDEFFSDFSFLSEENVAAGFDSAADFFINVNLWGPPSVDLISVYYFKSATRNTSNFDCHYYADSQGNIRDYYIGFGGTIPCDVLTKSKRSSRIGVQQAVAQLSNQTDITGKKAALWAQHLQNIQLNKTRSRSSQVIKSVPEAVNIQKLIHVVLQKTK